MEWIAMWIAVWIIGSLGAGAISAYRERLACERDYGPLD